MGDSMITDKKGGRLDKMGDSQLNGIKGLGKSGEKGSSFISDSNFDTDSHTSDYEDDRDLGSDVSGETHTYKGSSHSSETSYSSSDDDTDIAGFDNKIRVYDARFKIPARQSVG
jgi:hypothetical protein